MAGTAAGGLMLDRLSDINFKRYLRLIVTVIGITYLFQAAQLFLHSALGRARAKRGRARKDPPFEVIREETPRNGQAEICTHRGGARTPAQFF